MQAAPGRGQEPHSAHPLGARRGIKRAAIADGHTIRVAAYHLLSEDDIDRDRGNRSCYERDRQAVDRRLAARLEGLGYRVSLDPAA